MTNFNLERKKKIENSKTSGFSETDTPTEENI
jgi:hypothetical protein